MIIETDCEYSEMRLGSEVVIKAGVLLDVDKIIMLEGCHIQCEDNGKIRFKVFEGTDVSREGYSQDIALNAFKALIGEKSVSKEKDSIVLKGPFTLELQGYRKAYIKVFEDMVGAALSQGMRL